MLEGVHVRLVRETIGEPGLVAGVDLVSLIVAGFIDFCCDSHRHPWRRLAIERHQFPLRSVFIQVIFLPITTLRGISIVMAQRPAFAHRSTLQATNIPLGTYASIIILRA